MHAPAAIGAVPNTASTATTPDCNYHFVIPADRFKGVPVFNPTVAAQPYIVNFFTNRGVITVRMLTSAAPCTTYSFRFLAGKGCYSQTHWHRLRVQGIYVLQCGGPTGTGSGGSAGV